MPRKPLTLALVVVGLHAATVLTLGTSAAGSLIANSLEIFISGFAAAMCFGASRRGRDLSRPFWILVGCGMAMWGIANLGWIYYEVLLRIEPPTGSVVRFLFNLQALFFAMALFLDQDKEPAKLDTESLLDFTQLAIVLFLVYLGLYYIPSANAPQHAALVREVEVEVGEDLALIVLALVQSARARTPHTRKLYLGLTAYLAIYTTGAMISDYQLTISEAPTGTWFDFCWTLPLLFGALWAARWQAPTEVQTAPRRQRSFGDMVFANTMLAVAPLLVLLQVAELGSSWRPLSYTLLGISILCFATRLALSESHEATGAESLRRHVLAMDCAINGMAIVSPGGEYTYVNSAYAGMMGYENPHAMLGRPWRQGPNANDFAPFEGEIEQSLQEQGRWYGPLTIHHSDGTFVPIEMAITKLPDGGTVRISRDITQRKRAEEARIQAEAKYKALIEQVAAISYIAELGATAPWLYVSPQVESIMGYTPDEWLADSREWLRHVLPEDHHIVHNAEEAAQRGEPFQAEYRMRRKDGRIIWVSDSAVVVPSKGGHSLMEGLIVDITERKQLENQLQQARRVEAVGRLAGGIAHDFNNLLTIIKGYTELALKRPKITAEVQADIRQIDNAAERASTLVRQLLAFSRKQVLRPRAIDLNSIVLGLEKLLRRLINEDIEMVTSCAKDAGTVKADPAQIEQVIMNLVVNARDAMPHGGRLTLETANVELDAAYANEHTSVQPGRYVMLAVSDTGTGMSPETIAYIFEPFYTTKESGRGTGLGLSTVYGIVKQSGGYIWVYSEPGEGSTFKVYLPRVDAPAELLTKPEPKMAEQNGTETILLVEDEPAVRELIETILSARGYTVLTTQGPGEALDLCEKRTKKIHLLLTDVVMPGLSGRELAMRVAVSHPETRVLYISGYTDNFITQGGLLEEGIAFLQKPFTPAALAEKVRAVLDSVVAAR